MMGRGKKGGGKGKSQIGIKQWLVPKKPVSAEDSTLKKSDSEKGLRAAYVEDEDDEEDGGLDTLGKS